MGCNVNYLLIVYSELGEIIYNYNSSVEHSIYRERNIASKIMKIYLKMSYNTVKD